LLGWSWWLEWCERKIILASWWLVLEWCERKILLSWRLLKLPNRVDVRKSEYARLILCHHFISISNSTGHTYPDDDIYIFLCFALSF
jgi:hypothetical protein